ncbi:acyl carrier protein [Anaeromyxobacter sp. PSR-1]|uniref:acyl carrier protein n=1 Tax=Anaeromyxobacter sp. PSR-1 TaxID=1300915 RepID=UPI0005E68D96|nr:acyl carrier protein [Anaeromyxobacter sp. PSR-1]GAO02467.1 acyl carrier protein [Anaeromyxobacter sp. PSR-1]
MISERLKRVILRELELEEFPLTADTVAADVPGWDSLSHVRVIDAVEAEFQLRFRSLEILRVRSVGDLQRLIDARQLGRTA